MYYQQNLPNHMVTAVIVLNSALLIQYANPATEALLLKSARRLIGRPLQEVFYNSPINKTRLEQLLTSGQEFSDSDVSIEIYQQHLVSVEITASAIELDGAPHILLELKQIDQQKQISAEAFQQQQWESARDLIRGLAHEIKNPLGGLRGAAQLLHREITSQQQEYTEMIIEQADRLTTLVDRLLGPNQLPNFSHQNIHVVLEKVLRLTEYEDGKAINLTKDYDPSIPDLHYDEDKIHQVILNIVNNAKQVLNEHGTISFKTRAASNKTINGKRIKLCAQISIIDNGPGIPENIKETLFYPMVSGRSNGTGIGLSIAQTLVHQHQGKLTCNSRPGHTEFTILLPISEESNL